MRFTRESTNGTTLAESRSCSRSSSRRLPWRAHQLRQNSLSLLLDLALALELGSDRRRDGPRPVGGAGLLRLQPAAGYQRGKARLQVENRHAAKASDVADEVSRGDDRLLAGD